MAYDPNKHDRRSMRLRGYDYAAVGAYFVTICTQGRVHLFGAVAGGVMRENACGKIARAEWMRTGAVRENVALDAFVVMPNHVHGGIVIVETDRAAETDRMDMARHVHTATACHNSTGDGNPPVRAFGQPKAGSLSTIVGAYKSAVSRRINRLRGTPGNSVWQKRFYDRIIRTRRELRNVRRYIAANPARWAADRVNG